MKIVPTTFSLYSHGSKDATANSRKKTIALKNITTTYNVQNLPTYVVIRLKQLRKHAINVNGGIQIDNQNAVTDIDYTVQVNIVQISSIFVWVLPLKIQC